MLTISDGVLTEVMFDFIEAHLKECVAYALLFACCACACLACDDDKVTLRMRGTAGLR